MAVWLVAAALVAGAGGRAVAWAMERALASTVDAAVGEAGRFDLLLQVHQDRRREALAAVRDLLRRHLPGATVQEGPSAAGSTVLLVSLTPRWRNAATLERLGHELPAVPGVVAWVPLVEPSVVISRLHPALERDLDRWLEGRDEVAFSFTHGADRVVVLKDAGELTSFEAAAKRFLDGYRVVRVAVPGRPADTALARRTAEALDRRWPGRVMEWGPAAEGAGAGAVRWVGRLRDFFFAYATLARIEPSPGLDPPLQEGEEVMVGSEPARIVALEGGRWLAVPSGDGGGSGAGEPGRVVEVRRPSGQLVGRGVIDGGQARIEAALERSEALLAQLERAGAAGHQALAAARAAVDQMSDAARRIEQMVQDLARLSATASDPVRDTLLALGLSVLLGRQGTTGHADAAAYVTELKEKLAALQEQLEAYRAADLPRLRASVRDLRQSLPRLSGDEVASALRVLEQSNADPLAAPAGVELVLKGSPPPSAVAIARAVQPALGLEDVRVYVSPAAVASPSPRAALMRVVDRAAAAGAGLATAAAVTWTLVNDWAGVASLLQALRRGRRGSARSAVRQAAGLGALVGAAMAAAAGLLVFGTAERAGVLLLGGVGLVAGTVAGCFGPRLAPVDADAVEAARAMGMDSGGILATVVAPALRPWILSLAASRLPPEAPAGAGDAPRPGFGTVRLIAPPGRPANHGAGTGAGAVLEARDLVRRFGGRTVLDGLSLSVRRGETVVIMGPSGCGKSTLLRCLKGLVQPDAGTVRIDGQDLWALPEPQRRALAARVGMVFQRPQLVAHLSVLQNAALGAAAAGIPWPEACDRAAFWLSALGMGRLLDRRPAELSGGEGQRVAIARALAAGPEVVLWDEPTSHLDPMLAADLLALMEELIRGLRTTMLVVTHQPGFATRVGNRLVLMEHGRVVEAGPPSRVLRHPVSDVGRRLARLAAV